MVEEIFKLNKLYMVSSKYIVILVRVWQKVSLEEMWHYYWSTMCNPFKMAIAGNISEVLPWHFSVKKSPWSTLTEEYSVFLVFFSTFERFQHNHSSNNACTHALQLSNWFPFSRRLSWLECQFLWWGAPDSIFTQVSMIHFS